MRQGFRISVLLVGAAVAGLAITGCGQSPPSKPPAPAPAPAPENPPHNSDSQPESGKSVTPEQAGKIVTDAYGGEVIDVESDHTNGEPTWEVEVRNSKQGRIEVDVAQSNGAIVEMERD